MPNAFLTYQFSDKWRSLFLVALFNLVVVAFMGAVLRYIMVGPAGPINYKYLLHAHSHVALLGWLYSAVFVGLLVAYLPPALRDKKTYVWQFWLSQGAVAGMLVAFPVQGYAAASITFSTAHILLSYWFIYQFLKDARLAQVQTGPHKTSFRFVRAALFFLALSSLGPWAMGPIMATGRSGSDLYYNAIYFYLHFQYNGWFTFAVLGLLFWVLEVTQVPFNASRINAACKVFFWACLPAYLLSVLWIQPPVWVYVLAGIAGLAQVWAVWVMARTLWPFGENLLALFSPWARALLLFAMVAFLLKNGLQLLTSLPYLADLAYRLRVFIIGYLHLVLLGFVSFFLFAYFSRLGLLKITSRLGSWGMGLFVLGFLGTEALLFLQGTLFWFRLGALPFYPQLLFALSLLLPAGVLLFFLAQFPPKRHTGTSLPD